MNSWYFKNLGQTSESMDWNGCSKPTNGISPCSSPQHGYLSTSTPRRWPTSTLGHVGWLPVEPHRCFRFDSWRCSIWHIICVSGTWNNAWCNVIWIDMISCMIWYAHRMFHKMKYWGSWRLSTSSVLLMGYAIRLCVFNSGTASLPVNRKTHQHVFPQLRTFQQEDPKQSPTDKVKSIPAQKIYSTSARTGVFHGW